MSEFYVDFHDLREFHVLPQELRTILLVIIFIHDYLLYV